MGFTTETAIGKAVTMKDQLYQVIGVVEDTHYEGLQKPIHPLVLLQGHDYEFGYFPVKVQSRDMPQAVKKIETVWKEIYPNDRSKYSSRYRPNNLTSPSVKIYSDYEAFILITLHRGHALRAGRLSGKKT